MTTTMRALRLYDAQVARLERIARPSPGAGEVLLKVTSAGICGTDAALYAVGPAIIPGRERARWPVVLGHEFAGQVVETGPGVQDVRVGDLVASGAGIACGDCAPCRRGQTNLCQQYWTAGVHRNGGLAEYVVVPARVCEETSRHGVRGDTAALAQPMAVAQHAVSRGRLQGGERALILGAGGVGAFAAWAALDIGAAVTAVDRQASKLAVVGTFGDIETVPSGSGPLTELLASGAPWDVVYEMTGAQEALAAATTLVRPGGRIVVAGVQKGPSQVDMTRLTLQEIDVLGTIAHVRRTDLPRALELLGRREAGWADIALNVQPLEAVEPALRAMGSGGTNGIKTLIDPALAEARAFSA